MRKKTNKRKGKPKVTYSMVLAMTFLAAENENRQLTYFSRVPVGKEQVKTGEFCILKITPIVWFCIVSTHFFILNLSANALYDFHSGIVEHSKRNFISTRAHVLFAVPRSGIDNGDKHIKAIGRNLVYWEQNEIKIIRKRKLARLKGYGWNHTNSKVWMERRLKRAFQL